MLSIENTAQIVVDVQGKLAQLMHQREALFENVRRMIRGAQVLGIPIVWAEQNPAGLGPTVPEVAELLGGIEPIAKLSFSCCGEERFVRALDETGRKQVLVAGIEAHVCVYQTAADLVARGYEVQVAADAVSSRTPENKAVGLAKVAEAGASVTSTETALFELLKEAKGDRFKQILKIVK